MLFEFNWIKLNVQLLNVLHYKKYDFFLFLVLRNHLCSRWRVNQKDKLFRHQMREFLGKLHLSALSWDLCVISKIPLMVPGPQFRVPALRLIFMSI